MEPNTMNVLVVEPGKKPYAKEISTGLESLQREVGGYIEAVYPYEEPAAIICDEEGKLNGKPLNRALRDTDGDIYDALAGTFLVVGLGEDNFTSLSPELMDRFYQEFETPERFQMVNGKLIVTPVQEIPGADEWKKTDGPCADLYEKMASEQDKYRDWLKSQSPAEVLNHAYEYTIREDILMAMEDLELTDDQAQALLDSPTPLADVYRYFEKAETGHMDVIRESIENRADDVLNAQKALRMLPVYPHTAAYAKEHGELEQYRTSNRANVQCKEAIEAALRKHFDGMRLHPDAAKDVIQAYGIDRMMLVLANTVQLHKWDDRYSSRNKAWAETIPDYNSDEVRYGYSLNSHPAVLNGFIDSVRQEHQRHQPLNQEDIQAEAERIMEKLRGLEVPNSPNGTHYMTRVSPEFLSRGGSDTQTKLLSMFPFRSAAMTGMKDRPGIYITILSSEDRSKALRKPRTSVRDHLKQEPKQAEKKTTAPKNREPER